MTSSYASSSSADLPPGSQPLAPGLDGRLPPLEVGDSVRDREAPPWATPTSLVVSSLVRPPPKATKPSLIFLIYAFRRPEVESHLSCSNVTAQLLDAPDVHLGLELPICRELAYLRLEPGFECHLLLVIRLHSPLEERFLLSALGAQMLEL